MGGRAVVVDDGELSRDCLAHRLASHGIEVGQAWDLPSLLRECDGAGEITILLNMDNDDCGALLQFSIGLNPRPRIIAFGLSQTLEEQILACAEAGVDGMHLRSESFGSLLSMIAETGHERCSAAVSAILMRRVYSYTGSAAVDSSLEALTAREIEILELVAEGLTNREIAARLFVTVYTVKNHVHNMLTKLGVASRTDAVSVLHSDRYSRRAKRRV